MSRKRAVKKSRTKTPELLVNQPSLTSSRASEGKTELLVNEVVRNPQVIERLMNRPEVSGIMMQISTHRSGPLPEAEELARYEKVSPGFAKEIMQMAKDEQSHRHSQSSKSLSGAIWKDRIGQIFGLICVFVFSYIAYLLIEKGAYGWATTLLGVELVALSSVFVLGRKDAKQEAPKQPKKK